TCPDLLEARDLFAPVKVVKWDKTTVEAVGADGKTYRFKASDVERITDREDLERRAVQRIARQSIEDARGCSELAQWCFRRHVRAPLEPFLKRVLATRPDDPVKELAKALQGAG
ncbi:MAG: hypothetical protein ACYTGN_15765, partial [Planctomycetota bacterium]